MSTSYTDRLIEELMRDMLKVLPDDKRQLLEPRLRAIVVQTFVPMREIIDAAAERCASPSR